MPLLYFKRWHFIVLMKTPGLIGIAFVPRDSAIQANLMALTALDIQPPMFCRTYPTVRTS